VPGQPCRGLADRGRDIRRARHQRRREDDDQCVDVALVGEQLHRAPVVVGGRRGDHVDRVADASDGWEPSGQSLTHTVRQRRDLQAGRLARVRSQDAWAASVGQDGDSRPARDRLVSEERGHVEQLSQRVGAQDAGLAEQRIDGHVRCAQQCAGMG
jgi:hypothetical protein